MLVRTAEELYNIAILLQFILLYPTYLAFHQLFNQSASHNFPNNPPNNPCPVPPPPVPSPCRRACRSIHSLSHCSLLIFFTSVSLSTTSPLSKTTSVGREEIIKSIPRLLPIFSGASNSTSTKPTLLPGSAGQGGESEDMIRWRIGEMTLQGGQYPADQYVMRGVRDEVDSKIVSCRAAGWRILRKGWGVSGVE